LNLDLALFPTDSRLVVPGSRWESVAGSPIVGRFDDVLTS
jgi:hypothetical protein